jgi:hypothetical protein
MPGVVCAYGALAMAWLAAGFTPPERVELRIGHHLRPIHVDDVEIDYPAVMGSRERLWARYAQAWGWPPAGLSYEADKADLARHEAETAAHETFNYAVLDVEVHRGRLLPLMAGHSQTERFLHSRGSTRRR